MDVEPVVYIHSLNKIINFNICLGKLKYIHSKKIKLEADYPNNFTIRLQGVSNYCWK